MIIHLFRSSSVCLQERRCLGRLHKSSGADERVSRHLLQLARHGSRPLLLPDPRVSCCRQKLSRFNGRSTAESTEGDWHQKKCGRWFQGQHGGCFEGEVEMKLKLNVFCGTFHRVYCSSRVCVAIKLNMPLCIHLSSVSSFCKAKVCSFLINAVLLEFSLYQCMRIRRVFRGFRWCS